MLSRVDGRTSIHAGYGIGYTRIPFQIVNAFGSNPPGVTSVNFTSGTIETPAAGALSVSIPRPQGLTLVNTDFPAVTIPKLQLDSGA